MKIALESSDLDIISARVAEALKPLLAGRGESAGDTIFDKKGLSEYLKVDVSWIDKNLHELPHFKAGKYVRFKQSRIDRWIEARMTTPSPYLKVLKGR